MDDGIKGLSQMVVDFARMVELTDEEEDELFNLLAAAYRAGQEDAVHVARELASRKAWLQ